MKHVLQIKLHKIQFLNITLLVEQSNNDIISMISFLYSFIFFNLVFILVFYIYL